MPTVRTLFVLASVCAALAGCAGPGRWQPPEAALDEAGPVIEVGRFSRRMYPTGMQQEVALPPGWKPYIILPSKPRTEYALVDTGQGVALEAKAAASASGLYRDVKIDLRRHPWVEWRWKVDDAVAGADKSIASREDSPARLVITFHGDPQNLDVGTRAKMRLIKAISGRELPYATLMYVWSEKHPPGTVIPNPHTDRIQMIVAGGGPQSIGRWESFRRNVIEDYKKAFDEDAWEVISVGVMTDADNTGDDAHAHYGDIWFMRAP